MKTKPLRLIGPLDRNTVSADSLVIDTTSQSLENWSRQLSPFFLGPCFLYDKNVSKTVENAWQFCKVYKEHVDHHGTPNAEYWEWAQAGWQSSKATRYPMGKGRKPLYSWWQGKALSYVEARQLIYWPLYRDTVSKTAAFARLQKLYHAAQKGGQPVVLFDFDGIDHDARDLSIAQVLQNPLKPMGHALVLKAMLEQGIDVSPAALIAADVTQSELF